jgi:hypothetical protein
VTKRVFYIAGGRLCAYFWERGKFSQPIWFNANENGLLEFSSYLEGEQIDPVHVLVDFVEEEFRQDTVPHVYGNDRRALIRSKLNRLFRDTTYSHAVAQGREDSGRRDDKMLFTALIRPDLLAPWMSQINEHRVPLAGIYSTALISEALFKELKIDARHALLVTAQSGGLRQTFILDKQLKISRLAVLPSVEPDRYASFLLSEVEKIRRYLASLRYLPHDTPLNVYILGDARQLEDIRRQSPDSLNTRHHLITFKDAAKSVGIKGEFDQDVADLIYAQVLAKRSLANQYAPQPTTRYYRLHRTRFGLIAASILLFISAAGWSGFTFIEGIVAAGDRESDQQQAEFYNERYRVARARLPETPVESRQIKLAVEIVDSLFGYKTTPRKMLSTLSRGLESYPQVQLDRVTWKTSADPNASVGDSNPVATPLTLAFAVVAPASAPASASLYQLAFIKARIAPFDGDYRRALELVNDFAETIRQLPGVNHVRILSLPLDVASGSSLSGDAIQSAGTTEAKFEVRIALEDKALETG